MHVGRTSPAQDCHTGRFACQGMGNLPIPRNPSLRYGQIYMTKIIFDVTDLRKYISLYRHLSGIQRTMVMMIDECAAQAGADKIWLGYCPGDAQSYTLKPYSALGDGGMGNLGNLAVVLGKSRARHRRPTMEGYARKPIKRQIHTLIRNINAQMGNESHFTKRGGTIEGWRASSPAQTSRAPQNTPQNAADVCGDGDWLVMLDAGWSDTSWQGGKNWRHILHDKGVRMTVLVHDLIQMQNPEFIPDTEPMRFYRWLLSTLDTTDMYLANSKATAHDLNIFMQSHAATQPVTVLPLAQHPVTTATNGPTSRRRGFDVPEVPDTYARLAETWELRDDIRTVLKWPYVLCVGTMEARKNLWALAQVWQRLSRNKDIALPKLVIAGRKGSFNDDFNQLMLATGHLGGWVEIFHTATDSELDFLYKNCLFTAMPSFYEGWGLPVGESLSYGKTGVVSQASSMPEVGLDMVEYCDPADMASIEAACLKLIATPDHRKALEAKIAAATLRSWADVSRDMLKALG